MANEQNNNQSANEGAATEAPAAGQDIPPQPEFGPMGPPDGEAPESVDSNLILDTFFGTGEAEPQSGEGQGKGSNKPEGQAQESMLARSPAAPAANGEEGSPDSPGPSSTPTQQKAGAGTEGEGATAQTPAQGQAPSAESQPSPQLSVEDRLALANVQALQEQNQQLLERLQRLEGGQQTQTQGQQAGAQPASTNQPGAGEQPLRLVVPDDLYGAVMNIDEPAQSKQALSLLISAVAQNAVNAAVERVKPLIDQRLQQVTQTIEASKEVNQMEEAYFTRYPQHKNELFRSLIQSVVDEKYKAFPHAKWDEVMMDAVGATVNAKLQALGIDPVELDKTSQPAGQNGQGQSQANGGEKPKKQLAKKPAAMLDASVSGGVPADAGDFIRSTFE